jgi:hypothetical protein
MPRSMVGLLAAVATAMSALVASAHGYLVWVTLVDAAVVSGLAASLAVAPIKKSVRWRQNGVSPESVRDMAILKLRQRHPKR